jgi:hypothetical protein
MSNTSNNRDKNKPSAGEQTNLIGQWKQTNKPGDHKGVNGGQPNKPGDHKGVIGGQPNKPGDHKGVNGGQPGDGKNGSRPQSRSAGNPSNGTNSENGKDAKGGNRKPGENGQNGDIKSGENSSQPGNNTGGAKGNGTNNAQKSGDPKGNDVNGADGRISGSQPAVSTSPNRDYSGRAASDPEENNTGTTGRASADTKPNNGTSDGNNSRTASRAATSNVGLQRNTNQGRSGSGKTADQAKRAYNSNVRPSYYNSPGPYGEKVDRVMESPRPRDPPRKAPSKTQETAAKRKSGPATPATANGSPRSRAVTEVSEDDGEKEPCEKCGISHHLLQSEACEHKICKQCLPKDVESITVDTDCPVCQRKFLYGEAPGRSDQPPLNRFHLIKDIYASIRPPSCLRCEQTNQTTEEASCACRDCALYFCEPCANAHNLENISDGKGWKNHHIFLLDELKQQRALPPVKNSPSTAEELVCPKHEDNPATCYCQTCRGAYCASCREEHTSAKHDFLDEVETKVYLKEIVDKEYKSTSYDVKAFDQFTDALRMKRSRTENELKKQKMEFVAKCNELIRAMEKKRDAIVEELDAHASDSNNRGNYIQEAITDERRYADAMKKLMGISVDDASDDVRVSDEPDNRLLRIGEFVDQNEDALQETVISRDLVADVNNFCKMQHDVKLLTRKREEIFDLVEDHVHVDTVEDYWLNDEALLAKHHLRHTVDNSVCHVGAFRETELPFYQFLWPITEKYREYYGKETFILNGNTLQIEEGTTPDLIQGDIFKSKQFQVFVKAGSQRLEKTEVELFRNTEYSRYFSTGTGNQPVSGLVAFRRNGAEKIMSMVSGSKVILVKDDRIIGRPHVGKGSKVAAVDKSGNLLIPFLIGKAVIRSQISDSEEIIHLGGEEHAVMYTFDKEREYLWTVDAMDNVVKVYDYRKLAFLYGIQNIRD